MAGLASCSRCLLASRAHVVMVSVLMPTCLAFQQGDCAQPQEAEDGVCLEPGLLQVAALLSAPAAGPAVAAPAAGPAVAAPAAGPAGAAEGGRHSPRLSPLAALGLRASLLLGRERGGRHLSGAGHPLIPVFMVAIFLALVVCALFLYLRNGKKGPSEGTLASGLDRASAGWASAAMSPPVQGRSPAAGTWAGGASAAMSPLAQGKSPAAPSTWSQPSPILPTPTVHTLSPAMPRTGPQSPSMPSVPFCDQSLVLPTMRLCVNIPMESLASRRLGVLPIRGEAQRSLGVEALVEERQLSIRSAGISAQPRVTVTREGRQLKIYDRNGKLFGTLEPASAPNDCALLVDGEVRMKVTSVPGADLSFLASTTDGMQLASAGSSGADCWTLQVKPNVDAVLVAACMLSMIFYAPGGFYAPGSASATPQSAVRTLRAGVC